MANTGMIVGGDGQGPPTYPDNRVLYYPAQFQVFPDSNGWPGSRSWQQMQLADLTGKYPIKGYYFTGRHQMGVDPDTISIPYCHLSVEGNILAGNRTVASITSGAAADYVISGTPAQWGLPGSNGEQIRSANVGFAFSFRSGNLSLNTDRVHLSGFNFTNLTNDMTVTSIDLILRVQPILQASYTWVYILSAYARVIATIDPPFSITAATSLLSTTGEFERMYPKTEVVYDAMRSDGLYLGQITTTANTPSIVTEMNNPHSKMNLTLAQNDESEDERIFDIVTEISENMLTESGSKIVGTASTPIGLGEGTNVDTNVEIDMSVRYGEFVPLMSEDGNYIITEDTNQLIVVGEGEPDGVKRFGGYVSSWVLAGNKVNATVLSHSQELNNIMVETEAVAGYSYAPDSTSIVHMITQGGGDISSPLWDSLGQVFTMTGGSNYIGGIRFNYLSFYYASKKPFTSNLTVELYSGAPLVNGAAQPPMGTPIATGTLAISSDKLYQLSALWTPVTIPYVPFDDPVYLTNGATYTMIIRESNVVVNGGAETVGYGDSFTYVGVVESGSGYTGNLFKIPRSTGYQVLTSDYDIGFTVMIAGGKTIRNWYSVDPSQILKDVLRFCQSQGSRVKFSDSTIEMTGTVVTAKVNANTADEAIEMVLGLMPADWYIWYDYATDEVHAHPRPEAVTLLLEKGVNVVNAPEPTLGKTIEGLKNDILFSGGQVSGGDNLLVREKDDASIRSLRRGFAKMSDSRYTDATSARIVAQGEIERNKDPQFYGEATIIGKFPGWPTEVRVGELAQYNKFSTVMDEPEMQVSQLTDNIDTAVVKMGTLKPRVGKRIEDIKRNMAKLEAENNPDVPV